MELCEGKVYEREKVLKAPLREALEFLYAQRLGKLNASIERLNSLERNP